MLRLLGEARATLAERSSGAERGAQRLDLGCYPAPLLLLGAEQILEPFALGTQLPVLVPDLHFLKLAQVAQPHIQNRVRL